MRRRVGKSNETSLFLQFFDYLSCTFLYSRQFHDDPNTRAWHPSSELNGNVSRMVVEMLMVKGVNM